MIFLDKNISILIPIYNEVENIFLLIDEIKLNLKNKINFEIIVINDCSEDDFINKFANYKNNLDIKIINNSKNLGQSKRIYSGVVNATFENIVTMDGDGQNNPKDILNLSNLYFKDNYSLVSGIRKKRKDSILKRISSKIANNFRSFILNDKCPDTGCGIKIFKKQHFLKIPYFNGMHRFIPALFISMDQKVLYKDVDHRHRKYGKSKYGTIGRLIKGIYDIIRVLIIIKKMKLND